METNTGSHTLSVGDVKIPYEDEQIRVKVVAVSKETLLVTYERPDTGENVFVIRANAGPQPNSIDLDEFDPSFWTVTVDGENRPAENLPQILSNNEITKTRVLRERREIALETENE